MAENSAYPLPDDLRGRIHNLDQPSPWLQFYEIDPEDGSEPYRFVGYFDPELGGSDPDKVPFNETEFRSVTVKRDPLTDNADGSRGTWKLTVGDPKGEALAIIRSRTDRLEGATCRSWIVTKAGIGDVNNAFPEEYEVLFTEAHSKPRTVTAVIGYPALQTKRYPHVKYERLSCLNPWQKRYLRRSRCSYPSTDFGPSVEQDLLFGGVPAAAKRKYGWSTQQALQADVFDSNRTKADFLTLSSAQKWIRQRDADRFAPYLYRELEGDFDVHTVIVLDDTARAGWCAGLLIQDLASFAPAPGTAGTPAEDDEQPSEHEPDDSDWLLFASADDGAAGRELLVRETVQSDSTDSRLTSTDLHLRVERVGQTINVYSRPDAESSWTSRGSASGLLQFPSTVRIGVVVGADSSVAGAAIAAEFDFIQFTAGGLTDCPKTPEACVGRENTHRANYFRGMPSDRQRL